MADPLDAYSIQRWLESCPQAYLMDTEYGHGPDETEPAALMEDPLLRERAIHTTAQLVVGERCALAASSGLINAAPDEASKRFLATQTLDEARHVEIFTRRLRDLGVATDELESVIAAEANPHLVRFAEILLEKVDKKDFVAGVVGQNLILEGMAFSVFEFIQSMNETRNPKFAHTLRGTIADERRHVGFGENRIGLLVKQHPERKAELEALQRDMSYHVLASFASEFRSGSARAENRRAREVSGERRPGTFHGVELAQLDPSEMESLLADTVLAEFKLRLGRVGLDYQTPARP